jgi:hypothetical protein
MLRKTFLALVIVTAAAALFFLVPDLTGAANSPGEALTGQVSSTEEGPRLPSPWLAMTRAVTLSPRRDWRRVSILSLSGRLATSSTALVQWKSARKKPPQPI